MKFNKLVIENFKSFKGRHEFDFMDNKPGLYYIKGENLDEPGLGANGAGKSTLIDALVWCLYGTTARGLRAKNVKTWGKGRSVSATLFYTKDGKEHTVFRSWNPNNLTLDKKITHQSDINQNLGMSKEVFLSSVVIGQFNTHFFDLPPAAKTKILEEILTLNYWSCLANEAKEQNVYLTRCINETKNVCDLFKSKIESLEEEKETTLYLKRHFKSEIQKGIKEQQEKLYDAEKDLMEDEIDLDNIKKKLERNIKTEALLTKESEELDEIIVNLGGELYDKDKLRQELDGGIGELKEVMANLKNMTGTCPECFQELNENHIKTQLTKLEIELKEAEEKLDKETETYKLLKDKYSMVDGENDKYSRRLKDIKEEQRRLYESLIELETNISFYNEEILSIKAAIKTLKNKESPHERILKEIQQSISDNKMKLKTSQKDLHEIMKEAESCKFWTGEFKSMRLKLIEMVLDQLTIEVNNSLIDLGLIGWEVSFETERSTVVGGVTKGTFLSVKSPLKEKVVPWEAWSGGESQRLRIAGTMGLANLVKDSANVRPNVMFWDEPSNHLGGAGLEDLISYLSSKTSSLGPNGQIYLVDHRVLSESGDFTGSILIQKKENKSFIITDVKDVSI